MKKKVKKYIYYCYSCGSKLNMKYINSTYDNYDGEEEKYYKYSCPNNEGKRFWQKHDIWKSYQDY